MPIGVCIDNNVWDFLFERKLDLSVELPSEKFSIFITREAEFEIQTIPQEKIDLREFIYSTIKRRRIQTAARFGFYCHDIQHEEQRFSGFCQGTFTSQKEIDFYAQQISRVRVLRKTKLYGNEADVSIAAHAFHSVVLTLDTSGALKAAKEQGGKVVFLNDFDGSEMSLSDFIMAKAF